MLESSGELRLIETPTPIAEGCWPNADIKRSMREPSAQDVYHLTRSNLADPTPIVMLGALLVQALPEHRGENQCFGSRSFPFTQVVSGLSGTQRRSTTLF